MTKQLLLMMLLALMSVTGAWAAESEGTTSFYPNESLTKGEIQITAGAQTIEVSGSKYLLVGKKESTVTNKVTVTALNGVKIKDIIFVDIHQDDYFIKVDPNFTATGESNHSFEYGDMRNAGGKELNMLVFEFENGVTSTTIGPTGSSSAGEFYCTQIVVEYEYPPHTHHYTTDWHNDATYHWNECDSEIGKCTKKQGNKALHNYGDSGAAEYTCQTCGYVSPERVHQHFPASEWSSNSTQHWHECLGTKGECDADGKLYLADHTYGDISDVNATVYYTCTTCGAVNNTRKAEYEALDFLSMKAIGGNVTIGMSKTGTPADYDLQYSFDKTQWTSVALTATNNNIVVIPAGQTCYFRHGTGTAIDRISKSTDNYWTLTMTGSGTIDAAGNTMSLLDVSVKKTNVKSFAFANLFRECEKLTKAPKLPATSISERCYMGMFEGTGIKESPDLPADAVIKGSYQNMFKNCQNLETAPKLLATRVNWVGYQDMFNGCKKITEITLGNITTIENANAFTNWLKDTAYGTEGIIIAPDDMVANPLISLPSNWMYQQIKDYSTEVSNATADATSVIKSIGEDYIGQIKQATSNASAKNVKDAALSDITILKKYNDKLDASSFEQPTGTGMRLKVTKKDSKVYEFKTQDVQSVDYYRVNE